MNLIKLRISENIRSPPLRFFKTANPDLEIGLCASLNPLHTSSSGLGILCDQCGKVREEESCRHSLSIQRMRHFYCWQIFTNANFPDVDVEDVRILMRPPPLEKVITCAALCVSKALRPLCLSGTV